MVGVLAATKSVALSGHGFEHDTSFGAVVTTGRRDEFQPRFPRSVSNPCFAVQELSPLLTTNASVAPSGDRLVVTWRSSAIAGAVLFPRLRRGDRPPCGGSYRSASAAVTQMGAAIGWLQRNSGRWRQMSLSGHSR